EYANGWMFEFRVGDRSGQATAKYWGGRDRELVKGVHDSFNRDDVVHITGEVKEYRGQMEIAVSEKDGGTVRRLGDGEFDVRELIRAREDIPEMTARLAEVVRSVREPHLRKLLDSFASDEEFMEGFRSAPASIQLHAAAIGGLLHHTLNVVSLCEKMCELHPDLDRDLVVTAALLHDIGKVASFKVTSNITQTPEGNLLGHIVMGDQELTMRMNAIEGFPDMLALKLRHVLLAHHGKRDWGSPVEPMLPEALAVHMADDVDAKLDYMTTQLSEAVTEDDWIWDRRLQRLLYLR
ncbi:MAG: HD domain-containing protein, partial [Thermoplasmata archaeon]